MAADAPAIDWSRIQLAAPLDTVNRREEDLPWVPLDENTDTKVTHVNLKTGMWVVRNRMKPGVQVQTHKHNGPVFAFTVSGTWSYLESPEQVNGPGSYLFEPAGSTHTLKVADDSDGPADVWFLIHGSNLNLDADGKIEWVLDAPTMLAIYTALCEAHGHGTPDVLIER
ncbi:2,4'-dihydroxyacetophenone dioxygenase family protein [Streptomyces griseoluteus]|uniref:2,4'-dihydroxyacetophenone dioxygenase family protein n=1 Tax=Streptomyces griseoluteus TaxID=29306 RepID=UPI0037FE3A70